MVNEVQNLTRGVENLLQLLVLILINKPNSVCIVVSKLNMEEDLRDAVHTSVPEAQRVDIEPLTTQGLRARCSDSRFLKLSFWVRTNVGEQDRAKVNSKL